MSGRPRPTAAGIYHLATRSTTPDPLFRDASDRVTFVSELARTTARTAWTCIAACVMTTHYHLLVDAAENALPQGMQRLNWACAFGMNRRHGRRGHWVGGRYLSVEVVDDAHLLTAYRYIALNPVEAGLCASPTEWPWSSYPAAIGLSDSFSFVDPSIVLAQFGASGQIAIERLRGFTEAALR